MAFSCLRPFYGIEDVFRGLLKMLEKRGYDVLDFKENEDIVERNRGIMESKEESQLSNLFSTISFYDTKGNVSNRQFYSNIFHKMDEEDEKVLVYFAMKYDKKSITKKQIQLLNQIIFNMGPNSITSVIMIGEVKLLPQAKPFFRILEEQYNAQFFEDSELLYSPLDSVYVSDLVILTPQEKEAYLSRNNIDPSKLPQQLDTDPVSKYLGIQKGTLLKYIVPTFLETMLVESQIFYRIVTSRQEKERKIATNKGKEILGFLE